MGRPRPDGHRELPVVDLDLATTGPVVLVRIGGRSKLQWPQAVRTRPPSPYRTMFGDEYHYDGEG